MSSARVTITLPAGLLAEVDRYVREHPGLSRSAVCAKAITVWLQAEQDASIGRYYNDQSPAERQEDDRVAPAGVSKCCYHLGLIAKQGQAYPSRGEVWTGALPNRPTRPHTPTPAVP